MDCGYHTCTVVLQYMMLNSAIVLEPASKRAYPVLVPGATQLTGGVLWMMRDGVYYLYYFNRFIVALGLV